MSLKLDHVVEERSRRVEPPAAGPAPPYELSQSVAVALAEIFDQAPPANQGLTWIAFADAVKSIRPMPSKRPPLLPVAAGAGLALAGLLGGAYLAWRPQGHSPSPPALAQQAVTPAPPAAPSLRPLSPAPPTPPASITPPTPLAQPPSLAPPTPLPPPTPPAPTAPAVEVRPAPPPRHVAEAALDSRPRSHLRDDGSARALRDLVADCDGDGPCDLHTVVRADALAGAAFAAAARSGVPDASLRELRRRLANLRGDSVDSPRIMVGNYALLAHDLGRLAPPSPPRRSRRRGASIEP